jgi:hypothetical protein
MIKRFGKRRAEIMCFLNGLSEHEKLVVFTHLSTDNVIVARVPELARTVTDMHRGQEDSNLELEFLARRKGCRLEQGPGDRWRVIPAAGHSAALSFSIRSAQQAWLPRKEASALLRSLADQAQPAVPRLPKS